MKKKPFLLLEILIAFFLVVLCSVPLVKQSLKLYKSEIAHLEKVELERIANWTFTEVKEMLLKGDIPWEKIPEKKMQTEPFSLSFATFELPGQPPKQVQRSFFLKGQGEKIGPENQTYRLLGVCITLHQSTFWYRLPVQKRVIFEHPVQPQT